MRFHSTNLKRSGADRIGGDVLAVLGHRVPRRADHHARRMCEVVEERGKSGLERDSRGVLIDDLGLCDVAVQPVSLEVVVGVGDAIEVRFHRGGVEGRCHREISRPFSA